MKSILERFTNPKVLANGSIILLNLVLVALFLIKYIYPNPSAETFDFYLLLLHICIAIVYFVFVLKTHQPAKWLSISLAISLVIMCAVSLYYLIDYCLEVCHALTDLGSLDTFVEVMGQESLPFICVYITSLLSKAICFTLTTALFLQIIIRKQFISQRVVFAIFLIFFAVRVIAADIILFTQFDLGDWFVYPHYFYLLPMTGYATVYIGYLQRKGAIKNDKS